MHVRVGAFGWATTHDPLQLGKGDVHTLEINILAPDWQDAGQSLWVRRNTQEFMKHWNAAQIRGTWLRNVTIRFVDVNGRVQGWAVPRFRHTGYPHYYPIKQILHVLQPERGFQSVTVEVPQGTEVSTYDLKQQFRRQKADHGDIRICLVRLGRRS